METLIEELQKELSLSEGEAVAIIQAIREYIEKQHPLLKDLTDEMARRELDKIKSV